MVSPVFGFFQSFVPLARPMKFSTVLGALSGKSWQEILPIVVSKIAIGCSHLSLADFSALCVLAVAADLAFAVVDFDFVVADLVFAGVVEVCANASAARAMEMIRVRMS